MYRSVRNIQAYVPISTSDIYLSVAVAEFNVEGVTVPRKSLFALSHILVTVCACLGVSVGLIVIFCCVEWRAKTACIGIHTHTHTHTHTDCGIRLKSVTS